MQEHDNFAVKVAVSRQAMVKTMHNKLAIILSTVLLVGCSQCLAATSSGKEIFSNNCSRCHRTANTLRTDVDKIAELLNSQTIRQHRFTLDETEMQALINYLQQGGS